MNSKFQAGMSPSWRRALCAALSGLAFALMMPAAGAAALQSKTYQYDAMGRVVQETDAYGQSVTYTYDASGNRLTRTDALSRTTTYGYDALNRLVMVTDPAGGVTSYSYDGRDNLVNVTDPRGLTTMYTYNGLDQLLALASPDTGSTTYTPNAAGQVLNHTNAANQATTYQYDALGRVTQATYADGRVVSYSYDQGANGAGRLSSVSDADSSVSWIYDADGRVLTRTQVIGSGAVTGTLTYSYNSSGQLTSMTLPSGKVVAYGYDVQGRAASLTYDGTAVLGNSQYRPFGGITGWIWGNGQTHARTYDQNGRPDLVSVGNTVQDLHYDAAARIDAIVDLADNSQNRSFSYDTLDRLTGFSGQNSARSWFYDAVGNRTSQSIGTTTESYSYGSTSNRLTEISRSNGPASPYAYTATGHTSSDGTNSFSYDARERLVGVTTPVATASYLVNPLGQRVRKSVTLGGATSSATFVYDEAGRLVAEQDSAGNQTEYLWLGELPVGVVKGVGGASTLYYVHADHLSTPRQVTTSGMANTTVWRWDGEPFGSTPADADPDGDGQVIAFNLRFPGQYHDAETGLHYNYFRDYDPSTGRYIESDPIGLLGGLNTYAYVRNDPLRLVDPRGLEACGGCDLAGTAECQRKSASCKRRLSVYCYGAGTPCLAPCEEQYNECIKKCANKNQPKPKPKDPTPPGQCPPDWTPQECAEFQRWRRQ